MAGEPNDKRRHFIDGKPDLAAASDEAQRAAEWERLYQRFPNIRAANDIGVADAAIHDAARELVEHLNLTSGRSGGNKALHQLVVDLEEALKAYDALPSKFVQG